MSLSRRSLLVSASVAALAGPLRAALPSSAQTAKAWPLPLSAVRLKPSIWATAVETNRKYLLSLDPDRLLHNFRVGAGLEAKARRYGGWETQSIAGHTLGPYLSALSLMSAQTGDQALRGRIRYNVAGLAQTQQAHSVG